MEPEKVLQKANKAIDRAFEEVSKPSNTVRLSKDVKEKIIKRTLASYGADEGGKQIRLAPLSESYRLQRKGKLRFFTTKTKKIVAVKSTSKSRNFTKVNNLSSKTRPSKSNLTATGLLLSSLRESAQYGKIWISLINNQYTTNIFGKINKGPTTHQVLNYVEKRRPFFRLAKPQFNLLSRQIAKQIKTLADKYLQA